MNNKNEREKSPHNPMHRVKKVEHAKNFRTATKRLFKELGIYKYIIIIACFLAILGAVLSISAPNKLKDLTNEISKGLIIDTKNLKTMSKKIIKNITSENTKTKTIEILSININNQVIADIMSNNEISSDSKKQFQEVLKNISKDQSKTITELSKLNSEILEIILPESEYNNTKITTTDKIQYLNSLNKTEKNKVTIPKSISKILLDEIKINNIKISSEDQIKFLNEMSSLKNIKSSKQSKKVYKKLDKMPNSIKKIIKPKMSTNKIKNITILLIIIYALSAISTFIEHIIMTNISNRFAYRLRKNIQIKINKLMLTYFDNHAIGDIMSRVTNDIDTIAQSLNTSLATLISSLTLFLGSIIMMFYTNYTMAITAILSSLIGFLFVGKILSKSQKYFSKRQKELGNLNGHIEEIYSSLNIVKSYNIKEYANEKFDKYNNQVYEANRKSQFLSGLMMPMMGFIGNFGYVMVCIVGAILTMDGKISFGVIVAFMTYIRLFTNPLSQIAQGLNMLQSTAAASERIFEFMDEEELEDETNLKEYLSPKTAKGNIEFKNVTFTYKGNDKPTIKNFSAQAKKGQKIAIVGPTGAGKTTLVNLLMKFYNIDSGDILIDNKSIKNLTRENIHNLFTMVLQDTWLFEGTIYDNIKFNLDKTTDKEIKEVCKEIGLDHYIKTLPNAYNSKISNNNSISAGERQLLTIARGILKKSPFLILDEATSNVDTRTEEIVQNAMDKLAEGKTSFIIAHRLSTIKNADLILVVKDGNIIEQGNHSSLINKKGFYADLYNSQFEASKD